MYEDTLKQGFCFMLKDSGINQLEEHLPLELFQTNSECSFRHVGPMDLPLQGRCVVSIIILILLIQIELSPWKHSTFTH